MKIDVKKIAKLANLHLKDEEIQKFGDQLTSTISYVEILNEVPTDDINPTNQVTGLENVTRVDKSSESLSQDTALSNAKSKQNGSFIVDAILNEE